MTLDLEKTRHGNSFSDRQSAPFVPQTETRYQEIRRLVAQRRWSQQLAKSQARQEGTASSASRVALEKAPPTNPTPEGIQTAYRTVVLERAFQKARRKYGLYSPKAQDLLQALNKITRKE